MTNLLRVRFSRTQIDAESAERCRARVLRGAMKDVGAPRNLDLVESCGTNQLDELCFQQSTRDSAGPEVDVPPRRLRDCFLHDDVADLQSPVGLEYTVDLANHRPLVGSEIDDAVGDDDVRPGFRISLAL